MSFDLQSRLEALRAEKAKLAQLERELAMLKQQHRDVAAAFAQEQGRAALEGRRPRQPAQLAALEKNLAGLEAALPNARAVLLEDQRVFKSAALAALRDRHAVELPAVRARLEQAYGGVAAAIANLADIIGAGAARDILSSGEHVQPIRERLQRTALPDAGLLHRTEHIAQVLRRLLDASPAEAEAVASANAALFAGETAQASLDRAIG